MVWADDDSSQVINHTNFLLNNAGEKIILSVNSTVLDSISFGTQGANLSVGHCPNGTGSLGSLASSSFNNENCTVGLQENQLMQNEISVYPNPTSSEFTISIKNNSEKNIVDVTNTIGQTIYTTEIKDETTVDTNSWSAGIYFVRVSAAVIKVVVTK